MITFYNRDGEPISIEQFTRLFEDHEYRVVAQTLVNERWLVSTVWLGLDHSFAPSDDDLCLNRPPLIFETMVFERDQGAHDWEVRRYATEADARFGHENMVALVEALDSVGEVTRGS